MKRSFNNISGLVAKSIIAKQNNDWKGNYGSIRETSKVSKLSVNSVISKKQAQVVALEGFLNSLNDQVKSYANANIGKNEYNMQNYHPQYAHRIIMKAYVNRTQTKEAISSARIKIKNAIANGNYNSGKKAFMNMSVKLSQAAMAAATGGALLQ